MGRPPAEDNTEQDPLAEQSIGRMEMLYALGNLKESVGDGELSGMEYHCRFAKEGFEYQCGCHDQSMLQNFETLQSAVLSTFEEVEEGNLTEDDYYFALVTSHYYYTSGNYHHQENAMSTLLALLSTYNPESGSDQLQGHIESTLSEYITNCDPEVIELFPVSDPEENVTEEDGIWTNNSDGIAKNGPESDRESAWDAQTHEGLYTWAFLCINLLLRGFKLPPTKKSGSNPRRRIPPGKGSKLNPPAIILCLGLFSVPIPPAQAAHQETPITLRAGSNGVIPFNCNVSTPLEMSNVFYTVRFEARDRPFCVDGVFDQEGFISPDQSERFSTKLNINIDTLAVNVNIVPVSAEDEGTYELQTIYTFGSKDFESHFMTKIVKVHVPPSPAMCYFKHNANYPDRRLLHCHCRPGNGNSTMTCYQNGEKIPYIGPKEVVTSRTFWVMKETSPLVCCSHELGEEVTADSCGQQFRFPRHQVKTTVPPRTKSKEGPVAEGFPKPTNDNMLPTSTKEPVGSGYAMRGSILCSTLLPLLAFLIC